MVCRLHSDTILSLTPWSCALCHGHHHHHHHHRHHRAGSCSVVTLEKVRTDLVEAILTCTLFTPYLPAISFQNSFSLRPYFFTVFTGPLLNFHSVSIFSPPFRNVLFQSSFSVRPYFGDYFHSAPTFPLIVFKTNFH